MTSPHAVLASRSSFNSSVAFAFWKKPCQQIAANAAFLSVFLAVHLSIVYLYSHLRVGSFRRAGMWARLVHGLANIWLTLPFRELQGVDRGEDVSQERFLLALHLVENIFLMIVAKVYYYSISEHYQYTLLVFLYIDLPMLVLMLCSVTLFTVYHTRIKLYAGIPDTQLPDVIHAVREKIRPQVESPQFHSYVLLSNSFKLFPFLGFGAYNLSRS